MLKKCFKFLAFLVLSVSCLNIVAFAQETPKQDTPAAPEKQFVDISGQIFFQWAKELAVSNMAANDSNVSQFSLQRGCINFAKKFDDMWSAKLSTEIANTAMYDDTGKYVESRYKAYVKFAWAQAQHNFGPVNAALKFGMIDTLVIGYVDKLADSRWIYTNYIDKSSDLLKGSGSTFNIDTSGDLGASVNLNMMKMFTLAGLYANGNGNKDTLTENRDKDEDAGNKAYKANGHAWQGLFAVNPVQGVSAFAFYRNQNTNTHIDDNYVTYYGAGAAYSAKVIKVGATYSLPEKSTNTGTGPTKAKYSLLDSWVNVNLDAVIQMPVLLYGRFAMGKAENIEAETAMGAKGKSTTIYGLGAGYAASNNIRILAYYTSTKYKEADKADTDIYLKSEIKF